MEVSSAPRVERLSAAAADAAADVGAATVAAADAAADVGVAIAGELARS